jgi:hypothetical protein
MFDPWQVILDGRSPETSFEIHFSQTLNQRGRGLVTAAALVFF